jgi:hypothetical protein
VADDYDEYGEQTGSGLRAQLEQALAEKRELAAKAAEAEALRTKVARLEQEGQIRDAGLNLNETQRAALSAVHSGEWNPEAITKTASNLGFITIPEPPPVVDSPDLSAHAQIAAAAAGTEPPPASRDAEFESRIAQAQTAEEFQAIYREWGRPMV